MARRLRGAWHEPDGGEMTKHTTRRASAVAIALAAIGSGGTASAQSTWDLNTACNPANGTVSCSAGGIGATITGYASTGTGGKFVAGTITDQRSSGIGFSYTGESTVSPDHAIDNNGYTELLTVQFSQAMRITQLTTGWADIDADIKLLRWTKTSAPTITNSTTGTLIGDGWEWVGSYDLFTSKGAGNSTAVSTTASSSWWLISSYFGPAYTSADGKTSLDTGNDFFKLLSFTGTAQPASPPAAVPEPGSLALAGLALTGLFAAQRRRARRG